MRFLANENFPGAAVAALEAAGHDIVGVRMAAPGMSDPEVLAWAAREHRILLTFDKDFGELVLKRGARASHGIILFRIPLFLPLAIGQAVITAIASRTDWEGHFSVVEIGRVRMRILVP